MVRTRVGLRPGWSRRAVVAVGLCLALAGCGSSGDADSGQQASPRAGATAPTATGDASSSESTSESASASSSESASSATGTAVTLTTVTLHYPAGWVIQRKDEISSVGFDPKGQGAGQLLVDDNSGYDSDTVDSLAKLSTRFSTVKPVTRGPNRTVGGVEGYTLTGGGTGASSFYAWGAPINGREVEIKFYFLDDAPDAQSIIDSVLASATFG